MSGEKQRKRANRLEIELESAPDQDPTTAARLHTDSGADDRPVPEKPPHACPNCDYNLTGLTSRRCPECGEEFTLHEARLRANEIGEYGKEMRAIRRKDMVFVVLGIATGVIGLLIPFWFPPLDPVNPGSLWPWISALPCFFALGILLIGVVRYKTDWRWPHAIFAGGILALMNGLMSLLDPLL